MSGLTRLTKLSLAMGAATAALAVLSPGAMAQARAQEASANAITIQSQDLGGALRALARQTGTQIVFDPAAVQGLRAPAVTNAGTPEHALVQLLANSGLRYRSTGPDTYTILVQAEVRPTQTGDATNAPPVEEEIIVTAQKREERLSDVPVPVTALAAAPLVEANQLRIQDYYSQVPGLNFAVAGNGNEPVISIRGVTTGADTNPTVGIVIDDVPYGASVAVGGGAGPYAPDVDPGDLARLEVLRGPQGTLYGAASIGGLLKFVTVDPSTEAFGARLNVGSSTVSNSDDIGHSLRGSLNLPIGDTFALRLSGFSLHDPGYIDNAETGEEDVNNRDSEGLRIAALIEPTPNLRIELSALTQTSERGGVDDVDTTLGSDPQQMFLRGTGTYNREIDAYSAIVTLDAGRIQWSSITGYSEDTSFDSVDSSTWFGGFLPLYATALYGVDRTTVDTNTEAQKFSQELRAAINLGERVDWTIGLFYTSEESFNTFTNNANDGTTGDVAGLLLLGSTPAEFEESSIFTNVAVQLTDRFDVQLGGRWSHQEQTSRTINSGPIAVDFFGSDPFDTGPLNAEGDAFTYLVTPRFRVSPDLMFYARFASGYRPGGPNASCGIGGIPCSYDPDTTRNYDFGVKGNAFGDLFRYDVALYYIDWQDIQLQTISGGFGYTTNASRAEIQGIEVSGELRPTDGLTIAGWVAYNNAELSEPLPPGSLVGNPGDQLPYSSPFSASIDVEQEFQISAGVTAFFGGAFSYVDDRLGQFQSTTTREEFPSYTQLDLRAGLRSEHWNLNVFVNNLDDERGVLRGGLDAVVSDVANNFAYIQPRTIGVSLARSF